MDTTLEIIEADIYGILSNAPDLALAKILRADAGLTEADVAQKLVTLTGSTKPGLGIVVLQSEVADVEENQPGPPMRIRSTIQVIESVTINRGDNGTGIKASIAALRVLKALHLQGLGSRILYAEKNPVEPLPGKPGIVSYAVTVFADANGGSAPERVGQITIADSGGDTATLSTATAGASIYYTTDGSFPGPGNDAATLYVAPIPIAAPTTIRAAGFHESLLPSDIAEATLTP